jgi:2-polyprenyl-6-methoxyphenol hydroxylase-like FAD-dependent oxidoreductase
MENTRSNTQSLPGDVPVLVVGGGPAGMIAALQLSKNGIPCLLVERNFDTTKWPKMDITNCRSMELLKRLGVDEGLREVGMYRMNLWFQPHYAWGTSKLMLLEGFLKTSVSTFYSALVYLKTDDS